MPGFGYHVTIMSAITEARDPMKDEINISSIGNRVSGDKAAEQEKKLQAIKEKKSADQTAAAEADAAKQEAERIAKEKKEAERKAAEEAKAKAAEEEAEARRETLEKLGGAALAVGGAVVGSAAKSAKDGGLKSGGKTLFFGIAAIAIIALLLFLAWPRLSPILFPEPEVETQVAAELSEDAVLVNVTAEMGDAILGEARQKQELVVWEQDVQVESKITKALANIPVFSKTKTIRSFGTGVFTVNMGKIDEEAIAVDEKARTVVISIPHAQLQYITKDLEKTEFEDTQHAVLGFGDVKLTQEQQNLLEQSIEDAMRAELESEECLADADEAALLVVYDVYQPLISQVDNTYTLEVQFA